MSIVTPSKILSLRVMNPEIIERGTLPTHTFDHHGGTIGSKGTNWLLHDYTGSIDAIHAEIVIRDNHYCLIDRSGSTRINSSIDTIGLNRIIQLNEADTIQVGKYQIRVRIQNIGSGYINGRQHTDVHIHELIDQKKHALQQDHLLAHITGNETSLSTVNADYSVSESDSVLINEIPAEILDPLTAFSYQTKNPLINRQAIQSEESVFRDIKQINKADTYQEPITDDDFSHRVLQGDKHNMKETSKQSDTTHWSQQYHPEGKKAELNHVVIAPLLRGMNISINDMNTEQSHTLLIEAGQMIQATISGIQALYHQDKQSSANPTLLSRNLQPIEDNPLRLNQSYQDTIAALFSPDRSKVHLTPPAAINESLLQLAEHQNSIITAIQESLNTLLNAFSPDTLNNRFKRYAKTAGSKKPDDSWSWQMYNEYYSELISSRQTGFEKLFWEVFEQSYDRTMRENIDHHNTGTQNEEN